MKLTLWVFFIYFINDRVNSVSKDVIHLSDHFTYGRLLRFTLGPILMMVFTSIYWIVDGFFLSNYVGASSFAGCNLVFPVIMMVACIGFMFGTGGAALVSKKLGEQDNDGANKTFSLITYTTFVVGLVFSVVFFFLVKPIVLGFASINSADATPEMIDSAVRYGQIMIGGVSLYVMQSYFHSFFSVNEKSLLGFVFTFISGVINMFLDFLLIGVFGMGVEGAAIASLSGMLFGTVAPFIYFRFAKNNLIRIGKPKFVLKDITQSITNGISEFVSNVSSSIVTMVFNLQLLKYVGESGVVAYGVIGYVCFVFFSIFIGYSVGITPLIGYNYGAKNGDEQSNVLFKSLIIIQIVGMVMTGLGIGLAEPISYIFTNSDPALHALSTRAMRIFSICYLFTGYSMFGSAFFTGLNNGLISAIISICRTLIFQLGAVFVLPLMLGVDGIWASIIFAEFLSQMMTIILMFAFQKKYGYKMLSFKQGLQKNK